MIIRFSEKDLEGGNYLPEGENEVTIAQIQQGQSKAGADMLTFTFKDRLGREAREFVLTDEKSRWKLARIAVAAGVSKESLKSSGLDVPTLMGKKLKLVKTQTGVEMYEGKERKRYSHDFFPSAGGAAPGVSTAHHEESTIPF